MSRGPVVGLMLPAGADPATGHVDANRVIEAARRAEAAGFDGVYVGDHVLHPRALLESVVTLSAVAAATERISIGPCVMLVALRQPVVLAKQLTTITQFAPGRLRVGVGVGGEYPAEFEAVGVPLAARGRRMEEVVRDLRVLLAGEVPDADVPLALPVTPPACGPVPFLFAGWREPSLRRAAELGDGWIGYLLAPDSFGRRRAFLVDHRAERGLTGDFTTGMLLPIHPDPQREGARARAAAGFASVLMIDNELPERLFVAGPSEDLVEQLHAYWEAGCTELVLAPVDLGAGYLDQLDLLAEEVLPQLRKFA